MSRIVKICCFLALLLLTFASAEVPQADAVACIECSLEDTKRCNQYCTSRGCLYGECYSLCNDWCFCTC
jgi:hypothetical protein